VCVRGCFSHSVTAGHSAGANGTWRHHRDCKMRLRVRVYISTCMCIYIDIYLRVCVCVSVCFAVLLLDIVQG